MNDGEPLDPMDEDEDEPLTEEEERLLDEERQKTWEAEVDRLLGPRAVRQARNQKYLAELLALYPEPVIRGLLIALSQVEEPRCAKDLAEFDLKTADLAEILQPYEPYEFSLDIIEVQGDAYTVEISRGFDKAGNGGRLIFLRRGDEFHLDQLVWQTMF